MKANELRVTNLVLNDGVVNTVIMIGFDAVQLATKQGNIIQAQLDLIKPIHLTDEWLLKFGSEKINNSMFRMGALTFQPTTFTEGGSLTDRLLNTRKAMRVCFCGKFLVNLEYVHQYQNLYFALTNKELTVFETLIK